MGGRGPALGILEIHCELKPKQSNDEPACKEGWPPIRKQHVRESLQLTHQHFDDLQQLLRLMFQTPLRRRRIRGAGRGMSSACPERAYGRENKRSSRNENWWLR